ncbi:major facilitator superfamily [Plasmopara halstedii]|uniref:Hexose transporter 1 n=1 Tax=Plasmopara halstedii TaxID=4781 RepID=A0A0P1B4U8_PLAHL|nr:major facilitator superfamily [Plasmopara halstedii]CEG49417.1 major facilitator superfamily [Plasmopara halstedii]|eukprot:XP_024585786.1 major facilitator superfamily [Plasmopara halstedii]
MDDVNEKLLPTAQRPQVDDGSRHALSGNIVSFMGCIQPSRLRLAAWLISISSFMWGFSATVLNEQELATALVVVGCVLSAVISGGVGARIGQKKTILINNILYVIGGALCALATSKRELYAGRVITGLASGVVTNTVPILLKEISPTVSSGEITSLHQLSLTIGMLVSAVLGCIIISKVPSGWRYLNGFMILPPLIQCISASSMPESPWWLMKNCGREDCRATLTFLRSDYQKGNIEAEVVEIARVMEHRKHEPHVTWSHLLMHKRVMITGTILVFFQAMTGINTVMLYSAKIFGFAGVSNPFLATIVVGLTNVGVTILTTRLVDSYGRRPLLIVGTSIMTFALGVLSWSLLCLDSNLGFQGIIAVMSVLSFVSGFAVGLGAVVWVILGDITPVHIRPRAFAFFMVVSYLCNLLIAVFTLSAISFLGRGVNPEKNGIAKLYLILSGVAAVCLAYVYFFVGETLHLNSNLVIVADDQKSLLTEKANEVPRQTTTL